ncbi:MAG TPA: hypothetical protein VGK48_19600 [Terriglobia bacterium]|jgi:mRNA interferase MazF
MAEAFRGIAQKGLGQRRRRMFSMTCSRNDVVLLPIPFTDLTSRKVRPAIVIGGKTPDVFVVPVSSVLSNTDFPLQEWQAAGLNVPSGVKTRSSAVSPQWTATPWTINSEAGCNCDPHQVKVPHRARRRQAWPKLTGPLQATHISHTPFVFLTILKKHQKLRSAFVLFVAD